MRSTLLRIIWFSLFATLPGRGDPYEQDPVNYSKTKADTPVTRIAERIKNGEKLLAGPTDTDVFVELLKLLNIPAESQTFVYSKTSAQNSRITPKRPRALYFSDNAYVGWVQGGNIEVVSFDKNLGAVFHMIHLRSREPKQAPPIVRDQSCLQCHAGGSNSNYPGLLARSVYPDSNGQPLFQAGTFRIDHTSPLKERWGGWYVTGNAGGSSHLGNIIASDHVDRSVSIEKIAEEPIGDLSKHIDCSPYPSKGSSDIVALMVLEHQVLVHNALVRGNLITQRALHQNAVLQPASSETGSESLSPTYERVIQQQADKIVNALLFADEFQIEGDGVEGSDAFQNAFRTNAKECSDGRSLKDFRLYERIFKHRCSYLIYSDPFTHLPEILKSRVLSKLKGILSAPAAWPDFDYLSQRERERILRIIEETLPDWPKD